MKHKTYTALKLHITEYVTCVSLYYYKTNMLRLLSPFINFKEKKLNIFQYSNSMLFLMYGKTNSDN